MRRTVRYGSAVFKRHFGPRRYAWDTPDPCPDDIKRQGNQFMHRSPFPALTLTALMLVSTPIVAQDGEGLTFAPIVGSSFTEKFWIQSQEESGLPGSMML